MDLVIQPSTVSLSSSGVSIFNPLSFHTYFQILDKPIIFVQEEFHTNKETGEVEGLALVCSVQVWSNIVFYAECAIYLDKSNKETLWLDTLEFKHIA